MKINDIEFTLVVNEAYRRLSKDNRSIENRIQQCEHVDANAVNLVNKLMETECRLYLVGLCILFQYDLVDIAEPYEYLSSFSITSGDVNENIKCE